MKRESRDGKLLLIGFGLLFSGVVATIILKYFISFAVPGTYTSHGFYGEVTEGIQYYGLMSSIPERLLYFFAYIAIESSIKRSKYIFSIIQGTLSIILLILVLIAPLEVIQMFSISIFNPIYISLIILILLMLSKYSVGEFKIISLVFATATGIFTIGNTISSTQLVIDSKGSADLLFITAPIFTIIGIILFILPIIISPEKLLKNKKTWVNLSIVSFIIMMVLLGLALIFFIEDTSMFSSVIVNFIVIGIIILLMASDVLKPTIEKTISSDIIGLKAFTKPKRLTEEEVSISKEKKICLVCKSGISGHTFVCMDCNSFYCNKCYNALVNLENVCWACDVALDTSKPVEREKDEEEELSLAEETSHKDIIK